MSLKQRSMQCSGYIPASQYVPVYSRPHRSRNGRLHEEICPITPKPSFDDPYDARNRSIHEAVKLWLESSPNSVIGPVCRSPSSGSPPSHSSSIARPAAIASGSSASPVDREGFTPRTDADCNRAEDVVAVFSPIQEVESDDRVGSSHVGESNEPAASPQIYRGDSFENGAMPREESPALGRDADKSPKSPTKWRIANVKSPSQKHESKPSEDFLGELRTLSKEFDSVLVAAAIANETADVSEAHGRDVEPPALPPELLLKPPRRHENLSGLFKGDRMSASWKVPDAVAPNSTDEVKPRAGGFFKKSVSGPMLDEKRKSNGLKVRDTRPSPLVIEDKRFNSRSNSKKHRDVSPAGGSKRNSVVASRNSSATAAEQAQFTSSDIPGVLKNGLAQGGGSYEFTSARRQMQPSYDSLGSGSNYGGSQRIYETSDPYANGGKSTGSMKSVLDEAQQRKSAKSLQEPMSPTKLALEKAKKEKLQVKAAEWENAKNATFLNRYKREESKIHAWEEQKIAKANVALNRVEIEMQKKRAQASEKREVEVAKAHKRAEEKKANAEARRAESAAKAAVQAQLLRVFGKSPASCFCF